MKKYIAVTGVLLCGCMSGPRPYDGVLGYQADLKSAGLQVTYVEEVKVSPEHTLTNIAKVCSTKLGSMVSPAGIKVLSESAFEHQISMNIPIPIGVQSTGFQMEGTRQSPGDTVQGSVAQSQGVFRTIKLRKTVALCAAAP